MYLQTPCLRCGESKLNKPVKTGNKTTCLCDGCGKFCGYSVIDHVDGQKSYSLYLIGGAAKEKKRLRSIWLPERHFCKSPTQIIAQLDKADKLDKANEHQ